MVENSILSAGGILWGQKSYRFLYNNRSQRSEATYSRRLPIIVIISITCRSLHHHHHHSRKAWSDPFYICMYIFIYVRVCVFVCDGDVFMFTCIKVYREEFWPRPDGSSEFGRQQDCRFSILQSHPSPTSTSPPLPPNHPHRMVFGVEFQVRITYFRIPDCLSLSLSLTRFSSLKKKNTKNHTPRLSPPI